MKTSNKILLGTFLIALLILAGIHIALFAKYKKGEFTLVGDDMWPTNMLTYSLENVKYVSVENIESITIHKGDTSKLQYDKNTEYDDNLLSITRKQDTLFLSGKSARNPDGKWYRNTVLSLNGPLPVKLINSRLVVVDGKGTAPAFLDVMLDRSSLVVAHNNQKNTASFETFKVNAINKSRIDLRDLNTGFLDVRLNDSSLEENLLTADSIRIMTDMASTLELSGKNLIKAKITSYE